MASQTSTTTMPVAPLPASPTLTNPDMILPYGDDLSDDYDRSSSTAHFADGLQFSTGDWGHNGDTTIEYRQVGLPVHTVGSISPSTPIIYGNGTMLSDIGEVTEAESVVGRRPRQESRNRKDDGVLDSVELGIGSSPTIGYNAVMKRSKILTHERTVSTESTSTVTSQGQAAQIFEHFDDGVSVDDSNFQGDDEESVADTDYKESLHPGRDIPDNVSDVTEGDDQYSSAGLSKRAEKILANAKRRLDNMEGNLTRARSTLHVTQSRSMGSIYSSSPLTRLSSFTKDSDFQRNPGVAAPPSTYRHAQYGISGASTGGVNHNRGFSETLLSFGSSNAPTITRSQSTSASPAYRSGPSYTFPQNPRSGENSRKPSPNGSSRSPSVIRSSPPYTLALQPVTENGSNEGITIDQNDHHLNMAEIYTLDADNYQRGLSRSSSSRQMRGLRDQMQDLKGKISTLRDRAREDSLKRRSLQSLRTPSPFTAAEQWYTSAHGYGDQELNADAGHGRNLLNAEKKTASLADAERDHVQESLPTAHEPTTDGEDVDAASIYEDVEESQDMGESKNASDFESENDSPEAVLVKDDDYETANENEFEVDDSIDEADTEDADWQDNSSDDYSKFDRSDIQYSDAMATPLSHEDREDAFDYQHFFLHSAMGTISQQRYGRRDSYSSEGSVETTRGPAAPEATTARASLGHFRAESTDTVSTVATFATAREGVDDSDTESDDVEPDSYAVQPPNRAATPKSASRSPSASSSDNESKGQNLLREKLAEMDGSRPNSVIRHGEAITNDGAAPTKRRSIASFNSTGTARSFPLVNRTTKLQSGGGGDQSPLLPTATATVNSVPSEPITFSERQSISSITDMYFNTNNNNNNNTTINGNSNKKGDSPMEMLTKDDQLLVERFVASLGKCVLGLQEAEYGSSQGKLWRRRLNAARRVLEGEEGAV